MTAPSPKIRYGNGNSIGRVCEAAAFLRARRFGITRYEFAEQMALSNRHALRYLLAFEAAGLVVADRSWGRETLWRWAP